MKTRIIILISCLSVFSNCKEVAEEKHTIAKSFEIENYESFENLGGVLIGRTDKSIGQFQKDSLNLLALQKFINQSPYRIKYETLDQVRFIADQSFLFVDSEFCTYSKGKDSDFIIAIVKDKEVEVFKNSDVLKAWKINLTTHKFEEVESLDVTCINQWFRYDG